MISHDSDAFRFPNAWGLALAFGFTVGWTAGLGLASPAGLEAGNCGATGLGFAVCVPDAAALGEGKFLVSSFGLRWLISSRAEWARRRQWARRRARFDRRGLLNNSLLLNNGLTHWHPRARRFRTSRLWWRRAGRRAGRVRWVRFWSRVNFRQPTCRFFLGRVIVIGTSGWILCGGCRCQNHGRLSALSIKRHSV